MAGRGSRREKGRSERGSSRRQEAIEKEYANKDKRGDFLGIIDEEKLKEFSLGKYKAEADKDCFIAVLPPPDEEGYFGLKVFVHYDVGPDGNAYLCPKKMWGERCPICDEWTRLKNEDAERDAIRPFSFSRRVLFLVVNAANDETEREGVLIYDAAMKINKGILGVSKNVRTGAVVDVSDHYEGAKECGVNVQFHRTGKGQFDTDYDGFKIEDRQTALPEEFFDVPKIEELLHRSTYDEIAAEFGSAAPPVQEEAPAQESRRGRGRGRQQAEEEEAPVEEPRRRRGPVDEDEKGVDDGGETETARSRTRDDEPEPRRRSSSARGRAPADDEGEDDIPF